MQCSSPISKTVIQWKIRKVLGEADVALNRMFKFSRAEAEHVLEGIKAEAARVEMLDTDTMTWHELTFRKVRRGSVFGFKLGWVSHFVVRRRLRPGDEIGIYVDPDSSLFYFSVLSRAI